MPDKIQIAKAANNMPPIAYLGPLMQYNIIIGTKAKKVNGGQNNTILTNIKAANNRYEYAMVMDFNSQAMRELYDVAYGNKATALALLTALITER